MREKEEKRILGVIRIYSFGRIEPSFVVVMENNFSWK